MTCQLHYAETMMPRKVCALARHLGLPVTFVPVDLGAGGHLTPQFRALNANAKVPVLVDGDLVLWESDAIMMHLAIRAGSPLWPSEAARHSAWGRSTRRPRPGRSRVVFAVWRFWTAILPIGTFSSAAT